MSSGLIYSEVSLLGLLVAAFFLCSHMVSLCVCLRPDPLFVLKKKKQLLIYFFIYVFIYFWLHWIFIALLRLFLVVQSGGLLFTAVLWFLTGVTSLVAEHRL